MKRGQGVHTLRHAFATHLLSQGTDLYTISRLLGHTSIKTTVVYLHLIPERITNIKSPLDHLYEKEGGPSDE
ncbi:MAG: tyrosine-type recombinase/integrase [Desulfobacterales bacterium]